MQLELRHQQQASDERVGHFEAAQQVHQARAAQLETGMQQVNPFSCNDLNLRAGCSPLTLLFIF